MSVPPSLDVLDTPAEPVAVRRLPFAFAKRHGVLLQTGRVVFRPGASLAAVGEALRFSGLALDVAELDGASFDQALSEAYQQDSSAAMQMVEGLGDDMDLASLAEGLRETEDLMEQVDDAPIIRLINAILSEAVKENASDIHVETFEKAQCAATGPYPGAHGQRRQQRPADFPNQSALRTDAAVA